MLYQMDKLDKIEGVVEVAKGKDIETVYKYIPCFCGSCYPTGVHIMVGKWIDL